MHSILKGKTKDGGTAQKAKERLRDLMVYNGLVVGFELKVETLGDRKAG